MHLDYLNYIPDNCKVVSTRKSVSKKPRLYLKLECDIHGEFELRSDTLKDIGCKLCTRESVKKKYDIKWKKDCTAIHKGKYDYSVTEVGAVLKHSNIRCIPCDYIFPQTPASHKSGRGCPKCGIVERRKKMIKSVEDIRLKYNELGKNYDLSKVVYKGCKEEVEIICEKGHSFMTTPDQIFNMGRTCKQCNKGWSRSKGEVELFEFISQFIYCESGNRKILNGLEIDIFIPKIKLGIEYNGIYWHRDGAKGKTNHFDKKALANRNGIHFIHIYEDDWKTKNKIVKNKIKDTMQIKDEDHTHLYLNGFEIVDEVNKETEDLYLRSSLDPELSYEGILSIRVDGSILALATYVKFKDGILVKQVLRSIDQGSSNYYNTFIDYFMNQDINYYLAVSIDWIDNLYLIKKGITEAFSIKMPEKRAIINNKSYLRRDKEGRNTITKSGYAIFKL